MRHYITLLQSIPVSIYLHRNILYHPLSPPQPLHYRGDDVLNESDLLPLSPPHHSHLPIFFFALSCFVFPCLALPYLALALPLLARRHMPDGQLSSLLGSMKLSSPDVSEITQLAKTSNYQLACQKHFDVVHPGHEKMDLKIVSCFVKIFCNVLFTSWWRTMIMSIQVETAPTPPHPHTTKTRNLCCLTLQIPGIYTTIL